MAFTVNYPLFQELFKLIYNIDNQKETIQNKRITDK